MRIISFNANGIRSAANKGFFDWLRKQNADVVCLQETKAQEDQLTDPMFRPDGHHCFYRDATTKKGYSGVAIYSRREPDEVRTALGWAPFDDEGRYIEARYGKLSVVSLYVPSGSSGEERQRFKFKVMDWLKPVLDGWLASGRDYVLCGDWNIVRSAARHQELDVEPEEFRLPAGRARLAQRHAAARRTTRRLGRQLPRAATRSGEDYTWWSNRGAARANNVGWRIDYQFVTPSLRDEAEGLLDRSRRRAFPTMRRTPWTTR